MSDTALNEKRILVVEPDFTIHAAIRQRIGSGLEVVIASTREQSLDLLEKKRFDLVTTNLDQPESFAAFAEKIHKLRPQAKIIILSSAPSLLRGVMTPDKPSPDPDALVAAQVDKMSMSRLRTLIDELLAESVS